MSSHDHTALLRTPVKLEENMVIALETYYGTMPPGAPGEGARTEEDVLVTKNGYEILSKWPVDKITEAWISVQAGMGRK
jgi:Xaa-Pro aminopeptidase